MSAARILVVDDEPAITQLVAMALHYEGFEVVTAGDGARALALLPGFRPDLVVLDVMLPDIDGFQIVQLLRERADPVPVVFLTARDSPEDAVRGLSSGGDDYLTKPFLVEELIARIRAVLRRSTAPPATDRTLSFEDLTLDPETRAVHRAGTAVSLTPTEFRLLLLFLKNPRRVLTRSEILDKVWRYDFGGDAAVLETYMGYLRRKVDRVEPRFLHTVRGVGYVLRLEPR